MPASSSATLRAVGVAALAALFFAGGSAAAQRPSALRAGADNDAFNFWVPPWDRPDHEYTSGVRGAIEYDGALPWWGWPRLTRRAPADSARGSRSVTPRIAHAFSIGQAIYTGNREPNVFLRPAGRRDDAAVRPNAAWLYVEVAERDSSARGTAELSFAVGVVGPQALGEQMQNFFHSLGPEYQRATDWTSQLPFEPGFVARYARSATMRSFGDGDRWRGALSATAGATVGTIRTALSGGTGMTADVGLGPWVRGERTLRLALAVGGNLSAVMRDEFLDGTLFRASDRVHREPFVGDAHAAISVRWRQLGVTYRANRMGRQYTGQAQPAVWASIETEWRLSP